MTSVPTGAPPDGPNPSGAPGPSGSAGRRPGERPPPPGPLAVEAALLVDALRGLTGADSGGRRLWDAVADVVGAGSAGAGGAGAGGAGAGGAGAGGAGAGAGAPTGADVPAGAAEAAAGPVCPGHGRPCTSCPLCRLLAMFTGDRPEVVRHLLTAAESLAAAFRAALDAYSGDARSGDARDESGAPRPASPGAGRTAHQDPRPGAAAGTRSATAPRPRVQRIDVT
ncbi:hypothetical protein [Frankia sp. QA3]|uniref:hypothetical protein n=1 Tax=Frankia sp. QA3 TaxID=710111 RepID=UPI000269CCF1|nr:hypothetical protein [Frankia sp. QA3]EIV96528.1 hypothetical protein FraQA3DRAFT_6430 [Frankia sp. QA3]